MILVLDDLEQLGKTALSEFNAGLSRIDSTQAAALEVRAQRLEAKLEQLYAVAVKMAQREEDLSGVADIWARMVAVCDTMAQALSQLPQRQGAAKTSYDRILDIRNACEENRALHA
jgi:hypothetical protein